jgi:hypothetical protein
LNVFIVVLNFEFCLCLVRPGQSGSLAVPKAGPMAGGQPEGRQPNLVQLVEVLSALQTIYRWRLRCIATFKDNF